MPTPPNVVVYGPAGTVARARIVTDPGANRTVLIKRDTAKPWELFADPATEQPVGTIPCRVSFAILFERRPWRLSADAIAATADHLASSSAQHQLADGFLLSPDRLEFTFEYAPPPPTEESGT